MREIIGFVLGLKVPLFVEFMVPLLLVEGGRPASYTILLMAVEPFLTFALLLGSRFCFVGPAETLL